MFPDDWNEDIKFWRDGPLLLNEKVLAKYYRELSKLDKIDILCGQLQILGSISKVEG